MKQKLTSSFQQASSKLSILGRYKLLFFVVFIALVYGYVILTINSLSMVQPTPEDISAQSNPLRTASIDKKVVQQLQQLQDNSVSVKALFESARNNPFQE